LRRARAPPGGEPGAGAPTSKLRAGDRSQRALWTPCRDCLCCALVRACVAAPEKSRAPAPSARSHVPRCRACDLLVRGALGSAGYTHAHCARRTTLDLQVASRNKEFTFDLRNSLKCSLRNMYQSIKENDICTKLKKQKNEVLSRYLVFRKFQNK